MSAGGHPFEPPRGVEVSDEGYKVHDSGPATVYERYSAYGHPMAPLAPWYTWSKDTGTSRRVIDDFGSLVPV